MADGSTNKIYKITSDRWPKTKLCNLIVEVKGKIICVKFLRRQFWLF